MIRVNGLTKRFKLYHSPKDRLKEIVFRKTCHRDFTALHAVSFEVREGETLGIIGQNGAGKSTLLKILAGVLLPDSGTIEVDGKVTGLLELGTGFNPELTGIENIYMNGTFLGMTRDELDRKREAIIDFTELGDFIGDPIKTYSSGMLMRLAFSIAIHAEPKCFLVDEALSVGDAYFQQKCMRKIVEFKGNGGSIVFVSHDLNAVMTLCDTAILLDAGRIVAHGRPKGIVDLYVATICKRTHKGTTEVIIQNTQHAGVGPGANIATGEIEVKTLALFGANGTPVTHVRSGDSGTIAFTFRSSRLIEDPTFGILIRNRYGISIFGINTYLMGMHYPPIIPGEQYTIEYTMELPLYPDDYLISIAIDNRGHAQNSFEEYLIRLNDIAILKIVKNDKSPTYEGIVELKPSVEVHAHRLSTTGEIDEPI